MQTITSKTLLFHTSEPSGETLAPGDTLESVVNHEIKELGQHVLACIVTYRLPPNVRPIPGASEDPNDSSLHTFRKFYKFIVCRHSLQYLSRLTIESVFQVTNPLAVKTKVHPVRSPTALLTPSEREKVFLEVHIQNVTQETMFFERLTFEPTDDWHVQDPNVTGDAQVSFSGSLALMSPQDIRQYIFVLTPISTSIMRPLVVHPPGSIFPLGRLNIAWRSSYGEPGRLLTSMLTRRIPLVNPGPPSATSQPQHAQQPSHPVSAVPPYLKRERDRVTVPVPSRPQSPTIQLQSRPNTPPLRRPQSPAPTQSQQVNPIPRSTPTIDVHLTLREPPPSPIKVEVPFTLELTVHINRTATSAGHPLLLGIQHVLPPPPASLASMTSAPPRIPAPSAGGGPMQGVGTGYDTPRTTLSPTSTTPSHQSHIQPFTLQTAMQVPDVVSPRASLSVISSGFSTPTATSSRGTPANPALAGTFNYNLARQKLLVASPRQQNQDFYTPHDDGQGETEPDPHLREEGNESGVIYPPPYPLNPSALASDIQSRVTDSVVPIGASSFTLPPLTLTPRFMPPHPASAPSGSAVHVSHPSTSTIESTDSQTTQEEEVQSQQHLYGSYDFELKYVPLRTGFHGIGGIRLLYLGESEEMAESEVRKSTGLGIQIGRTQGEKKNAQIMKEYDVIAEVLVSP